MKRILPIISIILLISTQSQAQTARNIPSGSIAERIINLYPNPATSYITFDLQKQTVLGLSIQVYSFLGKKMFESQSLTPKVTLNLSDFNRGLYMYHLIDNKGKVIESGKFQVTK